MQPMTLREAVEIVEWGFPDYTSSFQPGNVNYSPSKPVYYDEAHSRWIRARAIVDAAVEFVEAYESASGHGPKSLDDMLVHELETLGDQFESAYDKLRDLERGESEVQP